MRQKRPIDRPLAYTGGGAYLLRPRTGTDSNGSGPQSTTPANLAFPASTVSQCKSKAYDRLKDKAFSSAQLSVSLAEMNQSLRSVRMRALQLAAFTLAIKKGNLALAAKVLAVPVPPKLGGGKVSGKTNQWLEFHLGWVPLVKDIGNTIDVFQQPIKNVFVKASASSDGPVVKSNWPPSSGIGTIWTPTTVAVRYGMEVAVNNPNLFLLNQLGFVNPVSVAWELVPFSFIVDWFVNIGQFLALGTDFLGLSTKNSFTTTHMKGTWISRRASPFGQSEFAHWKTVREVGISTPDLTLKPVIFTHWSRAATAIALLVGRMKSL